VASIISHNPEETAEVAREFAANVHPGEVVGLVGELGAGKTRFVKGFAAALGYSGEVTSPTFTLIHEYPGARVPLYHFDFYRLNHAAETKTLNLDDYFRPDSICIVEWADKFPELLPANTRWFRLAIIADDRREIREVATPVIGDR